MSAIVTAQHKNSVIAGAVPAPSDLVVGQIAVNLEDKTWFTKTTANEVVCLNQLILLDGGEITA